MESRNSGMMELWLFSIIATMLPAKNAGMSAAKHIYVLQKNGAYRRLHRFDCRQYNRPVSYQQTLHGIRY